MTEKNPHVTAINHNYHVIIAKQNVYYMIVTTMLLQQNVVKETICSGSKRQNVGNIKLRFLLSWLGRCLRRGFQTFSFMCSTLNLALPVIFCPNSLACAPLTFPLNTIASSSWEEVATDTSLKCF